MRFSSPEHCAAVLKKMRIFGVDPALPGSERTVEATYSGGKIVSLRVVCPPPKKTKRKTDIGEPCPLCKRGTVCEDGLGWFCSRRYATRNPCDWQVPG